MTHIPYGAISSQVADGRLKYGGMGQVHQVIWAIP